MHRVFITQELYDTARHFANLSRETKFRYLKAPINDKVLRDLGICLLRELYAYEREYE